MTDLDEKIERLRRRINVEIRNAVSKTEPANLYVPINYLIDNGGKRLRPLLVILSAEAVGATMESSLPAAVAVELLHNFTLVHDDIMDNDQMRRGRPTIHHKWDEGTAILAGDSLVALAYNMLLKTDATNIGVIAQVFTEGIIEVCEGQAMDKDFESRDEVTPELYMQMIDKKTARLFATACEMGALIGEGETHEVACLRNYGATLGRAFQIQDDLLDILSPEELSGKPFGSDIIQGKKTYLVIRAFKRANRSERALLDSVLGNADARHDEIVRIKELFNALGVLEDAQQTVRRYLEQMQAQVANLRSTDARAFLRELPQRLLSRRS